MIYQGLTTEQYRRVVEIAKKQNKTTDELVDEIEWYAPAYDSINEILNDLEAK